MARLGRVPRDIPLLVQVKNAVGHGSHWEVISSNDLPAWEDRYLFLGTNEKYRALLLKASRRTGTPMAALAAVMEAEAAKLPNRSWNPASRPGINPKTGRRLSSAAGLGQFIRGTWIAEAERRGTHLNRYVKDHELLVNGRVPKERAEQVLNLRYNPELSIEAIADLDNHELDVLPVSRLALDRLTSTDLAKHMYLGHQLGQPDHATFTFAKFNEARARELLEAQIKPGPAAQRAAKQGSYAAAHRAWLYEFVDRNVTTDGIVQPDAVVQAYRPYCTDVLISLARNHALSK